MEHTSGVPFQILVFLLAAVLAPPLFNRIGLGAIVGYLFAGVLLGPAGMSFFEDAEGTMRFAELGVVLLLFLIGLELELSRLLEMRRDILLFGGAQLVVTTSVLSACAWLLGVPPVAAVIAGFALSLSSTAVASRILDERGHLTRPYGQRTFSVLLAQDLAIVPAFALLPALAAQGHGTADPSSIAFRVVAALLILAGIVLAGRYLIDPVLRFIVRHGGPEVMIAATLLLVFGAAALSAVAGLSMALGAFLAGLLLAESSYRHALEINVAPFRSLLLALFFMGVGMSLDVGVVSRHWVLLLAALMALTLVKIAIDALLALRLGSGLPDAARIATLLTPTSEFAFVILPLAAGAGLMTSDMGQVVLALGVLSMMAGPPLISAGEAIARRLKRSDGGDGLDRAEDLDGSGRTALVIGFGRFGQTAAQFLLSEGVETILIDRNVDGIRLAGRYGFKVYYGDGARLDVLRAAGAADAQIILVCVESPALSLKIVDLVRREFPLAKVLVRSFDRSHSLALMERNVDFEVREMWESSVLFGHAALRALGYPEDRVEQVEQDIRRRDLARLELQRAEGVDAGGDLLHQRFQQAEPLVRIDAEPVALNAGAARALAGGNAPLP
ncbi:monovalent cation:proton antiporter-2 (CPA2) family protein [Terrihabitans rhizophilus]|uniref:Monovalent cation:proton antiporter-2 (CPA2) family protein n=1 Tax=Terrihabitans rhizophilus TaxID=3092662 RepID=A0ABU4RPW2_9HYPH|nr:monovalent cation:proton antiporter-2 (CPA2) family protein [Terrihabitans sp. PJ23]MDX6806885.1 monovalent cation:proton antiporter-2 (CPA2) family protein [Terrihabitans sp. PJ23]